MFMPETDVAVQPTAGQIPTSPVAEEDALHDRLLDMGYSEEEIENILALAALKSEGELLGGEMDYANELRKTATPEGLNPTGRVYTAANPLQHLGTGMKRYQGEQEARSIRERQAQIMDEQTQARLDYLRRGSQPDPSTAVAGTPDRSVRPGRGVMYK